MHDIRAKSVALTVRDEVVGGSQADAMPSVFAWLDGMAPISVV
jgi:hypothetical protein